MTETRTAICPDEIRKIVEEETVKNESPTKTNKAIYARARDAYIGKQVGHDEFYLWLATFIGVGEKDVPINMAALLKSEDPHMNDISTWSWDRSYPATKFAAFSMGLGWSFSDNICVMKALARKMVREYKAKQSESGSGEITGI